MDNCGKSGGIQTAGEKMMMERRHSGGYPTLSPQNPRGRRDVGKRCELAPREGRLVGGGSRRPMAPRRGGGGVGVKPLARWGGEGKDDNTCHRERIHCLHAYKNF